MKIADRAVLITGANRGLGRALVEEALRRGTRRAYAGTRQPFAHSDRAVFTGWLHPYFVQPMTPNKRFQATVLALRARPAREPRREASIQTEA
jgi:NAD(P)-dependent dehydrogenase (short-subunit alcohol dehydrogenase family)